MCTICMHMHVYVCTFACVCVCVCASARACVRTKVHINCVCSMYYSLYVPVVQLHVIHIYRQFVRNILIGTDHKMK